MTKEQSPGILHRREVWKHNSFIGHSVMMRAQCNNIICSTFASSAAKELAKRIHILATDLEKALRESRNDPHP